VVTVVVTQPSEIEAEEFQSYPAADAAVMRPKAERIEKVFILLTMIMVLKRGWVEEDQVNKSNEDGSLRAEKTNTVM
jgi:hypothetical protein